MRSGIYKITAPNGNCYVGSTVKFNKRWSGHRLASDSAKRNMSAAHTGRKASPEARANMVEAQRLIRERKSARLTTLIDFDLLTNPADGL